MARVPSPGTDEDAGAATSVASEHEEGSVAGPEEPAAGPDAQPTADPPAATEPAPEAETVPVSEAETAPETAAEPTAPTKGPKHAAPRHARHGRRHRRWPYVTGALALVLVAAAVVQLARPVPRATPSLTLARTLSAPGTAPAIPWPATGQGAFAVPALGLVDTSGPESPVPVASLTKVMTAYLVLRAHPLGPDEQGPTVTLSSAEQAEAATEKGEGDAAVPVKAGEQLTERQLLDALLVPSADNIADVLATWVAGSTAAFVATMNSTAAALDLHATHYADASGLDPASVSTASDQLRLAMVAMQMPAFAAVVDQPSVTLPVAGTVAGYVRSIGLDGIVGVKSGYTTAAKGCLVLAAKRSVGGRQVLVFAAVTGQDGPDPHAAADTAARAVLDAAGAALEPVVVARARSVVAVDRAPWGATAPMTVGGPVSMVAWPGDLVRLRLSAPSTASRTLGGAPLLWRLVHG